ncbi:uncharacterized protein PG986_009968 [Apiospora aurea]|uniref:Uncharacterized protein n=1 Tax=Apiospora aurea TaxID=335848 RepID=A0ABR1Q968_9PEZI
MQPDATPKDNCPGINHTQFDSGILLLQGKTVNQTFEQQCDTNYADGPENKGLLDLLAFYAQSFDECMRWCAQYNQQLQQQKINASLNRGTGGADYCHLVSIALMRKSDMTLPWTKS